ncbi:MAG: reverse transcriptase-like protein [Thermoleophilia bacterium]
MRPYYQQAKSTLARLERFELKSIPRESNQHADSLVNQALDEAVG